MIIILIDNSVFNHAFCHKLRAKLAITTLFPDAYNMFFFVNDQFDIT